MVMNMPKGGEFLVKTNSQGIRNPEIPLAKPAGGFRIECYGDSITYGHGVNSENSYEMQLQKLLEEKYSPAKKVDVINLGCPGYTAYQGWNLFNRLGKKYEPDLCILAFNYADPSAEEMSDEERLPKNKIILTMEKLLYGSELYLALRQQKVQVDKYGKQKDYYLTSVRVPLDRYKQIMREWAAVMKARNGHVIYLSLAMTTPDPFPYYADYRKACEEIAKETGNYYIDMNSAFKTSGQDMKSLFLLSVAENEDVDRIHPNEKGFAIMAKTINDLIEKEKLIK
jgi:lysophospholipase L1-like esterase